MWLGSGSGVACDAPAAQSEVSRRRRRETVSDLAPSEATLCLVRGSRTPLRAAVQASRTPAPGRNRRNLSRDGPRPPLDGATAASPLSGAQADGAAPASLIQPLRGGGSAMQQAFGSLEGADLERARLEAREHQADEGQVELCALRQRSPWAPAAPAMRRLQQQTQIGGSGA